MAESNQAEIANRLLHYPSLDGVRGAAAFLVLIFHSSAVLQSGPASDRVNRALTLSVSGFGDIAVAIFFALSGFLLFNEFVTDVIHCTGRKPTRSYLSRRFLRIYPAYWAALTAGELLIGPLVGGRFGLFTLTGRYFDSSHIFIGLAVAWTLSVEVAFYVFLPLFSAMLRVVAQRFRNLQIRVAVVALACFGLLVVPRLYSRFVTSHRPLDFRFVTSLFDYLDWFAVGMFLSLIVAVRRLGWISMSSRFRFATSRVLCWPIAAALYVWPTLMVGYDGSSGSSLISSTKDAHVLFGLCAFFVLVPVTIGEMATMRVGVFASRVMVSVGVVSYGFYLWHDTFLKYYLSHFANGTGVAPFLLVIAALTPLSLFVGWLSYRLIERPVMKLSW